MKKRYIILSLAFISIIGFSSCTKGNIEVVDNLHLDVKQCEYNNHRYNVFYRPHISRPLFSVVHDPDCPKCQNDSIEIN